MIASLNSKLAATHYRDAQHAKLAGNYDDAEEFLRGAIDAIPVASPSREDLIEELNFRVPLLRLDGHILALDQVAAESVYQSIRKFVDSHPQKDRLSLQLQEYKLKLDAMK